MGGFVVVINAEKVIVTTLVLIPTPRRVLTPVPTVALFVDLAGVAGDRHRQQGVAEAVQAAHHGAAGQHEGGDLRAAPSGARALSYAALLLGLAVRFTLGTLTDSREYLCLRVRPGPVYCACKRWWGCRQSWAEVRRACATWHWGRQEGSALAWCHPRTLRCDVLVAAGSQ